MSQEKVKLERTLQRITDKDLQSAAYKWLRRNMPLRKTSEAFANKYPERAITDTQLKLAYKLHKSGCTLRQIEQIMHLVPNGGNNAHRCIKAYEQKLLEARAARSDVVAAEKSPETTLAKTILEALALPVEDRKEKLQQAVAILNRMIPA